MNELGYPVLSCLIFFPLLAAVALFFMRQENLVRWFTLGVSLIEMALAIPLLTSFDPANTGFQFLEKVPWVEAWGLSYAVGIDGISFFMVLLTVFILPLCVLCSWTYVQKRVKEFHFCLLLMTTACIGVFLALDFILFYVFWEAMLVPMYLLIAVWGGPRRRYASIKFFLYTLAGSVLLLVAMIAFSYAGGTFYIPDLMATTYGRTFQMLTFLAMALAFAIKVPMFPFHTWLPAAHVEAPSAGSVILASVLIKMGAYGFLRFCMTLTPDAMAYFAPLMIGISIASIIYGGLISLWQQDIKKLVAYSSVAHMGFCTLGIFMFSLRGIEGALMVMLNHGIVTGALFMMIGAVYERSHSREIADNRGLGKYLPAFMGFWGLFALSSLGFPGLNSFVGEILVLISAFENDMVIGALAIIGAMLAAAYMLRLSQKMAWGEPPSPKGKNWKDLNIREWIYLVPMAALVIYLGLAPRIALDIIDPSIEKLLSDFESQQTVVVAGETGMDLPEPLKLAESEVKKHVE